ncbi:flagellar type III secretion system protein FlhB [bacterium]|nr:flagellar type III secretion system protein FlhB [bacterium]
MSSDQDDGDKTEQPTDRRRTQAREQGQIARSVDLTAATVLLTVSGGLYFFGPECGEVLIRMLHGTLASEPWLTMEPADLIQKIWALAILVGGAFIPLMGLIALGALSANLMQVGFLWWPAALEPKFSRLNPAQGFKRIASLSSLVRLAGSIAKILLVAGVGYLFLTSHQPEFLALPQQSISAILLTGGRSIIELGFYLSMTLVALAILDYGYQYWQHERELRMTKQEIREEFKETEGNPLMMSRRREAHRKLAEARNVGKVKTADFVLTNPTHVAVAIKYDPRTMPAPIVVAKGLGEIAAQIRKLAAEHGIPIIERKALARQLYRDVKVGRPIPVDLYGVMAELLSYVYRLTGRKPLSNDANI